MRAKKNGIGCIDLFCGAGGLTYGLALEDIPVVAGIDIDPACEHAYDHNNDASFICRDIGNLSNEEVSHLFGNAEIRILAGCAPCQPFSTYSQRYETVGTPRWGLLYQFANLIRNIRPEIVTMENVPNLQKHAVFGDFLGALKSLQYEVSCEVINCVEYGLPQTRRRTVLMASRMGRIGLVGAKKRKPRTVWQAIGSLPSLGAGLMDPSDPLHVASVLSPINLERIRASRPGGTWRDWPEHLVAECHRRASGRTYPGVYGRMEWDKPSPTLTTQFFGFGNGRFGHPEQNRAISLREGAILQGFPKRYSFVPKGEPVHFKKLGRLIGNAVPVSLGRVIGRTINNHLGIELGNMTGAKSRAEDERTSNGLVA